MARCSGQLWNFEDILSKPLCRDEYLVSVIVLVVGILFGATIGFIAVPEWEAAMVCALLSVPGGLSAGALTVVFQRQSGKAGPAEMLRHIPSFALILTSVVVVAALQQAIPSLLIRSILLTVIAVVVTTVVNFCRRRKGRY